MKLHALQLVVSLITLFHHAVAAPQYQTTVNTTGSGSQASNSRAGISLDGNYALSSAGNLNGSIQTDTWKIDGTDLSLHLSFDRSIGIPEKDIFALLRDTWEDIHKREKPEDSVESEWDYKATPGNAGFEVQPTVSDVLKWKDVQALLDGLTAWYNIRRLWVAAHFSLYEDSEVSERKTFASGAIVKKEPSPPPQVATSKF